MKIKEIFDEFDKRERKFLLLSSQDEYTKTSHERGYACGIADAFTIAKHYVRKYMEENPDAN